VVQGKLPFGRESMNIIGSGRRAPVTKGSVRETMTVREAVEAANRCIEQALPPSWIEGEVSNLKIAASGHAYFTLKDAKAALPTAMWRASVSRLRFRIEEGQSLRVFGRMGIYTAQGRFQFYAERAEPAGLGAQMLQLEQLKRKLEAEGLFTAARKRAIPRWPRVIGLVTSPTGAAVHDILRVVRRRCPSRVLLSPSAVQGADAAPSLIQALKRLEAHDEVDVIIIGRGGGSVSDLWVFNDESLARALADCRVPTISAVGHEVDNSICDLVADLRAATPSQAGELVVQDLETVARERESLERRLGLAAGRRVLDERTRYEDLRHRLERCGRGILRRQGEGLNRARRRLEDAGRALCFRQRSRLHRIEEQLQHHHPRVGVQSQRQRLGKLSQSLFRSGMTLPAAFRRRLATAAGKLDALSPLAVLERGYCVATQSKGRVFIDAQSVSVGERIEIRLHEGHVEAEVLAVHRGRGTNGGDGDNRGP